MRQTTERKEGLGENVVVGNFDHNLIQNFIKKAITDNREPVEKVHIKMETSPSHFIAEHIKTLFLEKHPITNIE